MKNANLMILEAERDQAKKKLVSQIKTIKNIVANLERKIENNETLYDEDGLQASGVYLDAYLSKLTTYQRAIEQMLALKESE
ncbi:MULTISPECIES: hypothetical protein [Bacillus amyloliquefaciens group]|uniref:hypothetical protein n=1 Tax=Bacillus amyloliquefaciens group TaxID=1938374 RepID=UPI0010EA839C|nr:hypothetical protein [Bacillus velezensis]MCY0092190.1 hypothetical protein [Bacillus velezensis]